MQLLEIALTRFVDVLEREIGPRASLAASEPGAGAAGGIGYAALAVLGARFESGAELVGQMIDLDCRIQGAALVITGGVAAAPRAADGPARHARGCCHPRAQSARSCSSAWRAAVNISGPVDEVLSEITEQFSCRAHRGPRRYIWSEHWAQNVFQLSA
ncbi:glycerate kinase [Arthrobacter sp. M4]|uniref:glycerate kinase n=1 Tax=Arthrobacter sp. M4 TaxID=218160 RepID=UPI0035ABCA79